LQHEPQSLKESGRKCGQDPNIHLA